MRKERTGGSWACLHSLTHGHSQHSRRPHAMVHGEQVLHISNRIPPSHVKGLIAGNHDGGAWHRGGVSARAIGIDGGGREVTMELLQGWKKKM